MLTLEKSKKGPHRDYTLWGVDEIFNGPRIR